MASNVFYYGNIGNGHSMKLLHNSVCHGIFLMMCEIGNLGEELGISLEDLINTFNCSNARSYISQERFPNHILNKKFDGKSIIKNLKKDLQLVKDFSDSKETSNNYIKLTSSLLNDFNNKLDLNDFTEIYKLWNKNIVKYFIFYEYLHFFLLLLEQMQHLYQSDPERLPHNNTAEQLDI
jgi:3-hydroxyisobutyrate dehydrogenase